MPSDMPTIAPSRSPFRCRTVAGLLADVTSERRFRWGRAYRDGRLVAIRVYVTIIEGACTAASPTAAPRLRVRVRFVQGIDKDLRQELEDLVSGQRKQSASSPPIKIVWEEPPRGWEPGSRQTHEGRLQAPQGRFALLEEVDFRLRFVEF